MSKEYTYILWDCGAMFFIKILENHFNHGIIKMPDNFLCEASLLADLFLHTKGLGWKILAINLGSLKGLNYSCKAIQLLFWIPPRFPMSSWDPWSCLVWRAQSSQKDWGEKRNQIVPKISLGLLGLGRGLDLGPVSMASKYFNTLGNNINFHIEDNFKNPFFPLILRSHPGGGTTFCLC